MLVLLCSDSNPTVDVRVFSIYLKCIIHELCQEKRALALHDKSSFQCTCARTMDLPKISSWLMNCVGKQRRLWQDCADAQAHLILGWLPLWYVPFSHGLVHLFQLHISREILYSYKYLKWLKMSNKSRGTIIPIILDIDTQYQNCTLSLDQ